MAPPKQWWAGNARERFWLESTDRADIGADLRAPLADDSGEANWRYTLFQTAAAGDVVFHYDKRAGAITSMSRIAGAPQPQPIVWAARGSYARERGAEPVEVPGYSIALEGHQPLSAPVTLEAMRDRAPAILDRHDALKAEIRGPLYFPFELSARPIRPLQGYAFKLPADFVQLFAALAEAGGDPSMPAAMGPEEQYAAFDEAIIAIETAAPGYAMAGLQALRTRLKGLQKTARTIFGGPRLAKDWAFHRGGRNELQFNVGIDIPPDGTPAFRAGVAFSFEPSRSLPDIDVLLPKVARFNAWMLEYPETFADMSMWHYQAGVRSDDYPPGPIPAARVRGDTFVFLGRRRPLTSIDVHAALRAMDSLLPLYEWVEGGPPAGVPSALETALPDEVLRLGDGRTIEGGRWITASTRERTLDIFLRHAEIQRRLRDQLLAEGCTRVETEVPLGRCWIDAVAQHADGLWFYEVKTASSVRACIREAVGQLLEYGLWSGADRPSRLIVVGEPSLDAAATRYLERLNAAFPIPLSYRSISLQD